MKIIFVFISLLLSQVSATEYENITNIPYYGKSVSDSYMKSRCVLDLYYPTKKQMFSTVVWFHGGGLTGGKKSIPEGLLKQGLAVIAVNYRLSPKVKVRQCLEDAAAAVAWSFKNIEKFGGSKHKIFLSGHSAGGYLASMIGMDKSWLKKHQVDADLIAGLMPLSGHTITHFTVRKEMGISGKQPIIDEMAPLFHVRKDAPPLVLITGDRELEMLGRYEENAYMYRMMKVVGHSKTKILELDGYGHGIVEPAIPLVVKELRLLSKK
ncbi:alpha/beta hydrolase [Lentisphaera marina]|uniref:alpha/beta hydrolase n=1 Tax=Lentisphaera marina TaxID=1111041 RepID=UPI002365C563|nr:alpha/beta hydrolase [Lentisphaera marina]MDD7986009.1 alpha/beta hydrolase [Lentisphaera marina]